jgi:hypothetical protein
MFLLPFGLPSLGEHSGPPHTALLAHSPAAARSAKNECRGDVRRTIRVNRTGTSCPNPPRQCDFSEDSFNRSHCFPLPLDQPLTDILKTTCQQQNRSAQRDCLRQNGAAILAPPHNHNRCAVVSSGGAMLKSGCGAQIDSDYDAVFRTNCPVLNGYEQDVGTRTDIMIDNGLISRGMVNGSHTVLPGEGETGQPRPLWQDGTVAILWNFTNASLTSDTLNRIKAVYNASYVAVDVVGQSVNSLFTDSASNISEQAEPSKGIVTILDAMRLCDQVDLFGFADPGGSIPYHCMQLCSSNQDENSRQRLVCNSRLDAPRSAQFGTRASARAITRPRHVRKKSASISSTGSYAVCLVNPCRCAGPT